MDPNEMRVKAGNAIAQAMHKGIGMILNERGKDGLPECLHLGCNTSLCALIPVIPFIVNRPHLSEEEAKTQGPKELSKLLTRDTVLFAALITARMFSGVTSANLTESGDAKVDEMSTCIEITQEVDFGPTVFMEALKDWEKLTGKNPDGVFDASFLRAIHDCTKDSTVPFDEFLEKRLKSQSTPSSKTLQ